MPLSAVNMVQNGHLIHQDVKQFVDILTGVMADQPVLVTNSVTVAGPNASFYTRSTPIGSGFGLAVVQPPGYTFTDDPHSGFYLDAFGEPGIMTNWNDGSNTGLPTMQFRQWTVQGSSPANGGRMIIMPRSTGIGWSNSDGSVTDTDGLIFFSNDTSQNVVALRSDQAYWGADLRIYGRYDKNNWQDFGYFEIDFLSSPPFNNNAGAVLLTTNGRTNVPAGGRPNPDMNIAPGGALRFGTGSIIRWGFDPNDSSGGSAFHPFGNAALGTPDFNALSTVFTNNVTLQQLNVPASGMKVWGGLYAPTNPVGTNGDWFLRGDTPGVTNQQIYQKVAGVWTPLQTGGGGGTTSILVYSAPAVTGLTVTLPQIPATNGVFEVSVNGQALMPTRDWTISGNVITFATALSADDVLVQYQIQPFNLAQYSAHYETTLAAGATSFTLPVAPSGIPLVTRGGVVQYQSQGHYSLAGAVITLGVMVNNTEDGHFSVDYIAGGGTDAATVGGLSAAQLMVRANLLTNGGFEIWQRGVGPFAGPGSTQYTADRWQVGGFTDTMSVSRDNANADANPGGFSGWWCAAVTTTHTTGLTVIQQVLMEGGAFSLQLRNRPLSLSVRVKTSVANATRVRIYADGNSGGGGPTSQEVFSPYHTGDGTYQTLRCTLVPGSINYVLIQVYFEQTGTYYVDNAMLVASSVPADYVPMHPADEIARCERYYQRLGNGVIGVGQVTATAAYPMVFLPARLAVYPTVTVSATADFSIWDAGTTARVMTSGPALYSGSNLTNDRFMLSGNAPSLIAGDAGTLVASAAGWLAFEANA